MNSRRSSPGPGQGPPQGPPGQHTPGRHQGPPPQHTQSLNGTPHQQHSMPPQQMMGHPGQARPDERSYAQALKCLESLPSNASVVASLSTHSSTGGDPNLKALPEMLEFFARAGYSPADLARLRCIHVAGTKGKGSVCAMIQSILEAYREDYRVRAEGGVPPEEKGLGRVGMYTSPHLATVRERIRIDGQPISKQAFTKYFFQLWDAFTNASQRDGVPAQEAQGPTGKPGQFRYLTILAWHVFLQEGIETAIIECGIGGEYDSTNILPAPAVTVSVITALGIDHVPMLGDSLSSIAWHKSGIMKKGVTCLTLPQPQEAMKVLSRRQTDLGARLEVVNRRAQINTGEFPLKLEGDFQKDNASLAILAVAEHMSKLGMGDVLKPSYLPDIMKTGLTNVNWPGRCQIIKEGNIRWCIDGAHTPDSLLAAAEWFAEQWSKGGRKSSMLIFASPLRDAPVLAGHLNRSIIATCGPEKPFQVAAFVGPTTLSRDVASGTPGAPGPPKLDLKRERETAEVWIQEGGSQSASVLPSIEGAVENAREIAMAKYPDIFHVFVTGSLKLVGGMLSILGPKEESDEWEMVAEHERERMWQMQQQQQLKQERR